MKIKFLFCSILIILVSNKTIAQKTLVPESGSGIPMQAIGNKGNGNAGGSKENKTFEARNDAKDSITIFYRKYNQFKIQHLDSSINNFNSRFPLPNYYQDLGNFTTAARSLVFNPLMTTGFGAGFHQFDVYNYTLENTKLYNTTKPFTELAYLLGSNAEQMIDVLHTQNKKDNLNYSLEYRFVNAPGVFKNQNTSLNNTRFILQYQSPNKRYHLFIAYIANKNAASENGGLVDAKKLDSLSLGNPFELQTRLGTNSLIRRSPFSTAVYTGNTYKQNSFIVKHQYDLGTKDSLVKDSSVVKLFYPRLRLQHILSIKSNTYEFNDFYADSTNYKTYFGLDIKGNSAGYYDTITFSDKWNIVKNEFSLISFPDKKNAAQFLKAGATIENISGTFTNKGSDKFYNILVGGEYRNRTKNKIWDIEALAQMYLSGYNKGDYSASISLQKLINKKTGSLEVGFQNINRTPEYIFQNQSSFFINNRKDYSKENTTKFWGIYTNSKHQFNITAEYFVLSNYLYFDSIFSAQQEAALLNVLHIGIEKKIHVAKKINWYTSLHLQQTTANAPINLPLIVMNNRFVFESNFYKNLFLATGLEVRYINNYKPNGYSPFNGQFYYQNNYSVANKPDVNFFFNFRIKSFKGFLRFENLNTLIGTGAAKYNYSTEQYPTQSLWMRFGVWWSFVN